MKILLHTFLGHLGALGRALTSFEARISLVDHVKSATALDDLAISVTTLGRTEGRENFHKDREFLGGGRLGGNVSL